MIQNHHLYLPDHVKVLGIDDRGRIWMWSADNRRLWKIPRLKDLDYPTYVQIGGQWVVNHICGKDQPNMEAVKSAIALLARNHAITTKNIYGQGIWLHKESIITVSGNQAASFDRKGLEGAADVREIVNPKIDDKFLDFMRSEPWVDLDELKVAGNITSSEAQKLWQQLKEMLSSWNFQDEYDADIVVALAIATPLQACWDIRPQIWVKGGTNTGKSAMQTLLENLWPGAIRLDNTTEAGLRQEIGNNALTVMLDEFEHCNERQKIIEMLRSSTRGGQMVRGTPGGEAMEFFIRHMIWIASIEASLNRAADRNRFIVIELQVPEQIIMPESSVLQHLGVKLLGLGLNIAKPVKQLTEELGKHRIKKADGRQIELFALPAAVWAVIHQKNLNDAIEFLERIIEDKLKHSDAETVSDEDALIEAILSSKVRVAMPSNDPEMSSTVYENLTVGQLLNDTKLVSKLENDGIRLLPDGQVFLVPKTITRHLLKGTHWGELNISDILSRIEGAQKTKQRIAGQNPRGIVLPKKLFIIPDDSEQTEQMAVPSVPRELMPLEQLMCPKIKYL